MLHAHKIHKKMSTWLSRRSLDPENDLVMSNESYFHSVKVSINRPTMAIRYLQYKQRRQICYNSYTVEAGLIEQVLQVTSPQHRA